MKRTIQVKSLHTMCIESISEGFMPDRFYEKDGYTNFYTVKNWDEDGCVFFYMAKGLPTSPKEIVVWYNNSGRMWSGYGKTFKEAIEGAQRDGWMYA